MQDSFKVIQPKWTTDKIQNDYHGACNTTEDEESEEENQEYVFFEGKVQSRSIGFHDIDLMDFPISGCSVSLPNCMKLSIGNQEKLLVKKFDTSKLIRKECGFCQEKLTFNCKVVELPCRHLIHYSCVEKWNVITRPCRKCDY